jgi:thiamine biosynthesis lipoprotein
MSPDLRPTRREVVALGVGTLVVALLPMARRRSQVVRRTLPVMGTIAEVVVVDDIADPHRAIDAAMAELTGVEWSMSRFRADSDIGRANTDAWRRPVTVGAATASVVREALTWARLTDGAFDPAIGRVVELWDVTHRHEPPPADEVRHFAGRKLHTAVEVESERGQPAIAFASADIRLDLGGIAKGYAVDRAAEVLRGFGVRRALVNVGGDLVAIGHGPDGDPWRVGVRSPSDARALLETVDAVDCAIATSGDYEQFFRHRGQRYHHLMDPGTAAPSTGGPHSVTVRAARCLDADAAATAAFHVPQADLPRVLAERRAELVIIA